MQSPPARIVMSDMSVHCWTWPLPHGWMASFSPDVALAAVRHLPESGLKRRPCRGGAVVVVAAVVGAEVGFCGFAGGVVDCPEPGAGAVAGFGPSRGSPR